MIFDVELQFQRMEIGSLPFVAEKYNPPGKYLFLIFVIKGLKGLTYKHDCE